MSKNEVKNNKSNKTSQSLNILRYSYVGICWFFALIFIWSNFLQGAFFLLAGLVLIPKSVNYLKGYIKKDAKKIIIGLSILLFILGITSSSAENTPSSSDNEVRVTENNSTSNNEDEIQAQKEKEEQERIEAEQKAKEEAEQKAKEEEVKRKEEERVEAERLAKEEAERKAREEKLSSPQPFPEWKVLKRDANSLVGNIYETRGKVLQIQYAGDYSAIRLDISNEEYNFSVTDYIIYIEADSKVDVFEGDIVTFVLESTGEYTYESISGYNITLPSFEFIKRTL